MSDDKSVRGRLDTIASNWSEDYREDARLALVELDRALAMLDEMIADAGGTEPVPSIGREIGLRAIARVLRDGDAGGDGAAS